MTQEDRWGDIFKPIKDSWASHDSVRNFMYESIYATIRDKIEWQAKDYNLVEFGCLEPTSSLIRMITYDMRNKLNDRQFTLYAHAVEYPLVDIQGTVYDDEEWDITIADQVLEHVKRPWLAADELHRITKTGGLCIAATPFIHPLHFCPLDCWRIAPDGYKVLFPEDRWEYLLEGAWGDMQKTAWYINSPITRGLTGEWLSVEKAKEIMPCYNNNSDGLWPTVIFNVMRRL